MGGSKKKDTGVRAETQNEIQRQTQRFENQQGPAVNAMAYNYGRGSEANYGDYTDIMNMYRGIASGAGSDGGAGGGGGGGGGGGSYTPFLIGYKDPFNSYTGFTEFSNTGGYSPQDMANLRARGMSPIRAAYANAEREVGRQRALQGGYSPNAFAVQARMAREMGQANADAVQNVEAGIIDARNKGRLSGLEGMFGVEGQRLAADLDVAKYNAQAQQAAQSAANAGAAADADRAANAAAVSRADQLRALQGMTSLYGTTPAMAATFGSQLLSGIGQGANFGQGMVNATTAAGQLPSQYQQNLGNINSTINTANNIAGTAGTIMEAYNRYRKPQGQSSMPGYNPGYGNIPG